MQSRSSIAIVTALLASSAVVGAAPSPTEAFVGKKALGSESVILKAVDVHRSAWYLFHPDGSAITYQGWNIDVSIDESKLDRSKRGDVVMKADAILLTAINAHPK